MTAVRDLRAAAVAVAPFVALMWLVAAGCRRDGRRLRPGVVVAAPAQPARARARARRRGVVARPHGCRSGGSGRAPPRGRARAGARRALRQRAVPRDVHRPGPDARRSASPPGDSSRPVRSCSARSRSLVAALARDRVDAVLAAAGASLALVVVVVAALRDGDRVGRLLGRVRREHGRPARVHVEQPLAPVAAAGRRDRHGPLLGARRCPASAAGSGPSRSPGALRPTSTSATAASPSRSSRRCRPSPCSSSPCHCSSRRCRPAWNGSSAAASLPGVEADPVEVRLPVPGDRTGDTLVPEACRCSLRPCDRARRSGRRRPRHETKS